MSANIFRFPRSCVVLEGMMHLMDHEEVNGYLLRLKDTEGLHVQLSYDGLRVPINL